MAALVSAGILAYFGQRNRTASPQSSAPSSSSDESKNEPPTAFPKPLPPRAAPQLTGTPGKPPSPEEAEALRGEPSQVNPDVRDKGIDGALGAIRCEPPSRIHDKGREGPGGLGCFVEGPDKTPIRVRRWALKNPNGMVDVGDFELGRRTGTWLQYHPNGFKAAEGDYDRDGRVGVWREWDDAGHPFAYRTYKDGAPDGVTVIFRGPNAVVEMWDNGTLLGGDPSLVHPPAVKAPPPPPSTPGYVDP